MRAQCCICADLFENSANINIAAVPCGHTFHEECLMRWLQTSSTCPSCRKQVKKNQIIKRLFFDISEEEVDLTDPNKLMNEINSLKAQICDNANSKRELAAARDALSETLAQCIVGKEDLQTQLQQEQGDKKLLHRELAHTKKDLACCERQLKEFAATQKKLKELESVQLLLEGSEHDVSEMVGSHGERGEARVKQLSSMVVVVKREYDKALQDKKTLRDTIHKLKAESIQIKVKNDKWKQELKKLQLHLKQSNQDMFSLERENNANRRKIAHLRSVIKDNKTDGSQSFIAAVNEDSPNVAYTPPPPSNIKTTTDSCLPKDSKDSTSPNSPDLFEESDMDVSKSAQDNEAATQVAIPQKYLQMVRISSAAEKFQAAKRAKIEQDKNSAAGIPFSNFSILQKKLTGLSNSRVLGLPKSRVYNGLGGSVKAEESIQETPVSGFMKALPLKRRIVKKRKPLAIKPLPNQQKLKECFSECLQFSRDKPAASQGQSVLTKKQPCVKNPFSASTKASLSSISRYVSSSSSTKTLSPSNTMSTNLRGPSSDVIDLT